MTPASAVVPARRFSSVQMLGLVMLAVLLTAALTLVLGAWYVFPREFAPVTLDHREQQVLNAKLDRLDVLTAGDSTASRDRSAADAAGALEPERYSEAGASRSVRLTEKELNALLARNTDLSRRLAIDLSDGMVSAKMLVPVDPGFPVFGGKMLRISAGLALDYRQARPVVMLKGVSLMGVPLPNAWLGGLKNVNLVQEFGGMEGFWKALADGIEHIRVEDGQLVLQLRE